MAGVPDTPWYSICHRINYPNWFVGTAATNNAVEAINRIIKSFLCYQRLFMKDLVIRFFMLVQDKSAFTRAREFRFELSPRPLPGTSISKGDQIIRQIDMNDNSQYRVGELL
jgi:hypothetical protein